MPVLTGAAALGVAKASVSTGPPDPNQRGECGYGQGACGRRHDGGLRATSKRGTLIGCRAPIRGAVPNQGAASDSIASQVRMSICATGAVPSALRNPKAGLRTTSKHGWSATKMQAARARVGSYARAARGSPQPAAARGPRE